MYKKLYFILFFLLVFTNTFADELWHAHEDRNHTSDHRLKLVLSSIKAQKIQTLGSKFMGLEDGFDETLFYNFQQRSEYVSLIESFDRRAFRNLDKFKKRMKIFSFYQPDKDLYYKKSNDSIINENFLLKSLTEDISTPYETFKDSLKDGIDSESDKFVQMAKIVASGDLSKLGYGKIVSGLVGFIGPMLIGKELDEFLINDILEITSPGKDPTSSTDSKYNLEGTTIYLTSLLIKNRGFKSNFLFNSLMRVKRIQQIPADLTLYQFFKNKLGLSPLNTIRLINLANHNHGIEYYMANAIIDLSNNVEEAQYYVKESFEGLNRLYKLIQEHEVERTKVSSRPEDQYNRRYHFWGGALVTCELLERGYSSFVSKYASSKLGSAYEHETSQTEKLDQESINDAQLHTLGAEFASTVCQ